LFTIPRVVKDVHTNRVNYSVIGNDYSRKEMNTIYRENQQSSQKGDRIMISKNIGFSVKGILSIMSGFFVFLIAASPPSFAATQWNVGVSGGNEGISSFNLSIGDYYHVPEREVVVVHERGINEEELPVVFFIAQRARVSPEAVVDLHLRGMNWMDITLHYGLSPEIYYVPVRQGPPYGNAYGHYKRHPKGGWQKNDLRDADIVNQVNLKFISEHHRYSPEQVMKYRSEGKSFTSIDRDARQGRQGKTQKQGKQANKPGDYKQNDNNQNDNNHQGKGQGKGDGKKWDNN
jgi:hypothetical protein